MNWIDVKDKLPEHFQVVLCRTKKGYSVTVFVDDDEMHKAFKEKGLNIPRKPGENPYSFASIEIKGNELNGVTHWMYIPEFAFPK